MSNMICKYISYNEATRSQTATSNNINNTPNNNKLMYDKVTSEYCFDMYNKHNQIQNWFKN